MIKSACRTSDEFKHRENTMASAGHTNGSRPKKKWRRAYIVTIKAKLVFVCSAHILAGSLASLFEHTETLMKCVISF